VPPADLAPSQTDVRIRAVDPTQCDGWDEYVARHEHGLVYHHSSWLRALQAEYGRAPVGLTALDAAGTIVGLIPLMATRGLPLPGAAAISGRRLSSLPRTPVAGPIADDRPALVSLLTASAERTPPGAQLQLKLGGPRLDGLLPGMAGHPWRTSYVLQLPGRPEDLRFGSSRNHAAVRRAVNKAHRSGVRVRLAGTLAEVRRWYALYLETMRHHLVPPRSWRLFRAAWDEMRPRGTMRLLIAERDGDLLAGCMNFQYGSTAFYGFNGVRRDALDLRPNDAIHWEAIHRACAEGLRAYDFGEVAERHEGLARFKAKWGTEPRRLHRYYLPAPEHPPGRGDGVPGALTGAWQRVPLRLTAIAGDVFYRFL
jgi:hypothetical protein